MSRSFVDDFRYLSVCSGIEAATVAWRSLGWVAAAYSEIEKFPRSVLQYHYPEVPLHGDFTTIKGDEYGPIDLICGGTPCQDYSNAGTGEGLDGERGALTLEFSRLAGRCGARWKVWENVPGVFSTNAGRDFGAVLATFAGYPDGHVFDVPEGGWKNSGVAPGYKTSSFGIAWRVLDLQCFGIPQRRRRVVLVGYLGDWRTAAAVLFEPESLQGHPAPLREKGQTVAGTLEARASTGGYDPGAHGAASGHLVPQAFGGNNTAGPIDVATAQNAHSGPHGRLDFETETFIADPVTFDTTQITSKTNGSNPLPGDPCHTLARGAHAPAVAWSIMPQNSSKDYKAREVEISQPLMAGGPVGGNQGGDFIQEGYAVRRLTPTECERLMGFQDGYTQIPYRGKAKELCPDGPRYKALGNSWGVPVFEWVGRRIHSMEALIREQAA